MRLGDYGAIPDRGDRWVMDGGGRVTAAAPELMLR